MVSFCGASLCFRVSPSSQSIQMVTVLLLEVGVTPPRMGGYTTSTQPRVKNRWFDLLHHEQLILESSILPMSVFQHCPAISNDSLSPLATNLQ